MQAYYDGKKKAKEMRERRDQVYDSDESSCTSDEPEQEDGVSNAEISTGSENEWELEELEASYNKRIPQVIERYYESVDDPHSIRDSTNSCSSVIRMATGLVTPSNIVSHGWVMMDFWPVRPHRSQVMDKNLGPTLPISIDEARAFLDSQGSVLSCDVASTESSKNVPQQGGVSKPFHLEVRLLSDAREDCCWSTRGKRGGNSSECEITGPSLNDISLKYTLNKRQHVAFCIAGRALLGSFIGSVQRETGATPLRMHIGGEGGTGESRIIAALRSLSKGWGRPKAVMIVAPTGKAASLIQGETVHSKFNLMRRTRFKPTEKDIERFADVHMLIWDEISMSDKKIFARVFQILGATLGATENERIRIHVVTLGDFFQQPPVKGQYLFEEPRAVQRHPIGEQRDDPKSGTTSPTKEKGTALLNERVLVGSNALEWSGFMLWRSFETVIMLSENMRHQKDPRYGELLARLRSGECTKEDVALLNSRVFKCFGEMPIFEMQIRNMKRGGDLYCPFAVQNNAARHCINWSCFLEFAKMKRKSHIPILSVAEFSEGPRSPKFTEKDMETLYGVGDEKLERLPPLLPLLPGMPVYVTQNIATNIGVANGSFGYVSGIKLSPDSVLTPVNIMGVPMLVSSKLPELVVVDIRGSRPVKTLQDLPTSSSEYAIPILAYTKTGIRAKISGRSLSLSSTQIPLTPAFAATVYKLQGTTLDGIVILGIRPREAKRPSLYVMLSRVVKLDSLFLMRKLEESDIEYFKPLGCVVKEEERLGELCKNTLSKYESLVS